MEWGVNNMEGGESHMYITRYHRYHAFDVKFYFSLAC